MKRGSKKAAAPPRAPQQVTPADFWKGSFGDDYTKRNRVKWEDRIPFWQHILEVTNAGSFLEVGTNAGWNLRALKHLNKDAIMTGVDLNDGALREAQEAGFDVEVLPGHEVASFFGAGAAELSFTSGVLIHVPPADLLPTMCALRDVSSQYVLAIEYDSQEEREIEYRGHAGKLWARPFGQLYEGLGLSLVETGVAQGFVDCRYWLLEKS